MREKRNFPRAPRWIARGMVGRFVRPALATGALAMLLLAMLVEPILLGQAQPLPGRAGEQAAGDNAAGECLDALFFSLTGPNDGEPINSRILRLKLQTTYETQGERSILGVSVNGAFIYSRALGQNGHRDGRGVFHSDVDIDLVLAGLLMGADLLHPDAGPLQVGVDLYASNGRFVASDAWSGYIGKPWFDIGSQPPLGGRDPKGAGGGGEGVDGARAQEAALPAVNLPVLPVPREATLHPMRNDIFYFLVASRQRALLTLSPDDPRLLMEGQIVSCGTCLPRPPVGDQRISVSLLCPPAATLQATYLVLWTFDAKKGAWKRSVILPLSP